MTFTKSMRHHRPPGINVLGDIHPRVSDPEWTRHSASRCPCSYRGARFVSDYIRILLARLDDEERWLLLATLVCADFSLSFATLIGGLPRQRTAAAIRRLESFGVTTERQTPRESVFEHHPYMREALKRTAEDELDVAQLEEIQRQYANYIEPGRPDQALSIYCRLGDLKAANGVVTRNFSVLESVHASATAASLRDLPADQLAGYPILLSAV